MDRVGAAVTHISSTAAVHWYDDTDGPHYLQVVGTVELDDEGPGVLPGTVHGVVAGQCVELHASLFLPALRALCEPYQTVQEVTQ